MSNKKKHVLHHLLMEGASGISISGTHGTHIHLQKKGMGIVYREGERLDVTDDKYDIFASNETHVESMSYDRILGKSQLKYKDRYDLIYAHLSKYTTLSLDSIEEKFQIFMPEKSGLRSDSSGNSDLTLEDVCVFITLLIIYQWGIY